MAASRSKNEASRSSARIRVLTNQTVTARFLNPLTGDRPRTRAEKAAVEDAAGPRNGNLLDAFSISKPSFSLRHPMKTNRRKDAGDWNDDIHNRASNTVDDSNNTSMPGRRLASGRDVRGKGKRKDVEVTKRQGSAKRRRQNAPPQAQAQSAPHDNDHETTPDWLTPALQICWPEIFRHAVGDSVNQGWLLQTATVCRALAEPVMNVLYDNPRITSDKKMQKLIATLELPETLFYYRGKIRSLHLGPEFLPRAPALTALMRCLPRLQHFSMTPELDQAPYRDLATTGPKTEPGFWAILDERSHSRPGMVESPSRLLSWKWSGRLLPDFLLHSPDIIRLHTSGPLRGVRRLHLVNLPHQGYAGESSPEYNLAASQIMPTVEPGMLDGEEDEIVADYVVMRRYAQVINSLAHLEHLVLEASWVVEGWLWPLLPRSLKHLEVTHCWNLYTENMQEFLALSGQNLVSLTLNHNSALSLGFLVDLRRHCPNLEKLVVNMSYYKDPSTNSAEPDFSQALGEGQVPTWPSSLRHVELLHVRPWKAEVAAMLFQSLIDSASELPNLRYLVIKSMLDLDWRKRADLRANWLHRLQAVFLRPPSNSPTPTLPSASAKKAASDDDAASTSRRKASAGPPTRRSGRIHTQHTSSPRRSSRSSRLGYAEPPSDPEDDADGEASDNDVDSDVEMSDGQESTGDGRPFVQGLCERVELTMENHKLAEVQFDMDDFVDASVDEESDSDYSS